jgi:hypothetical protein
MAVFVSLRLALSIRRARFVAALLAAAAAATTSSLAPTGSRRLTVAVRPMPNARQLGIALLVALSAPFAVSATAQVQPGQAPEPGTIAFVRHVAGADEIFWVRADGSGLRRLTLPRSAQSQLVWAPDGTRVARPDRVSSLASPLRRAPPILAKAPAA